MTTNLETKVPTLETCIRARDNGYPQGKSYFVWMQVYHRPWEVVPRAATTEHDAECIKAWKEGSIEIVDAPMLQEVLEEVAALNTGGVEISFEKWSMSPTEDGAVCSLWKHEIWEDEIHVHRAIITSVSNHNPSEAALLLWEEANKEKPVEVQQ